MPYTPGHSSPPMDAGPASSPSGKTEITEPSPQVVRKPTKAASADNLVGGVQGLSLVAQGKQPVQDEPDGEPQTPPSSTALIPTTPNAPMRISTRDAVFLNDMDPHDVNFVSRYLVVDEFPETVANGHELTAIGEVMKNYIRFDLSVPMVARFLRIRFDNLSHACEAQYILEQLGYVVKFSTMHDHAKAKGQESTTCDVFEGQIRLSLTITTQLSLDDLTQQHQQELLSVAQFVAQCYGTVRDQSLYQIAPLGQGVFQATFRIEFQSIDSASRCVPGLTAFPVKGPSRAFTWYTHSVSYWTDTTPNPSPQPPRVDAHGRLIGFLRTEVQERAIIPSRHPADQHNRVTAPRILDGNDTRTTVMLRNIPNKLDWMALKQILDRYCFGLYDFIYLRIDFSSGNNVGYAFINFINTNGVLAILDKLDGKTWDGWRSGKAAEVSYATIQGKDALIQKFRNSSVMREAPYCRPRLFFSYEDEGMNDFNLVRRLGCDAPFPEPDNPAKLSRSMENARSVGLFPAHGANEMEHRNRHSMYDRGTPRDQIQSAMYQASAAQGLDLQLQGEIQRWFGYQNQHTYTTPFDRIPSNAIQQFFAANPWVLPGGNAVAHNPGVIGRPTVIPNGMHPFQFNGMAQALPSSYENTRDGSFDSSLRQVNCIGGPPRIRSSVQPSQPVRLNGRDPNSGSPLRQANCFGNPSRFRPSVQPSQTVRPNTRDGNSGSPRRLRQLNNFGGGPQPPSGNQNGRNGYNQGC